MELSSKIKAMKFMKRKEDVEERRQQEAVQRELAQQGHWKLGLPTPSTSLKFRVEYDASIGGGNNVAIASNGRHSYNVNKEEKEKEEEGERRSNTKTKNMNDIEVSSSSSSSLKKIDKRPRE